MNREKTYKEEKCKVYRNGWHLVEYAPRLPWSYFPLGAENRYFLIEAAGDINEEQHFRCCCTEITLVKELDLKAFAGISMKYMIQNPKMDWEKDSCPSADQTGNCAGTKRARLRLHGEEIRKFTYRPEQ